MSFPSDNRDIYGFDGFADEFAPEYNTNQNQFQEITVGQAIPNYQNQQPIYYPQNGTNNANDFPENTNVVYQGHEYQASYGFGTNNTVPQYCDPTGYHYVAVEQRQEHPNHDYQQNIQYLQSATVGNSNHANYPQSFNKTVQESPMNFEVPKSNNTQLSNESDFVMLDISTSNPIPFQANKKPIYEMTDDRLGDLLGDFDPFCVPVTPMTNDDEVYQRNHDPALSFNEPQHGVVEMDDVVSTVHPEPQNQQNPQQLVNLPLIPLHQPNVVEALEAPEAGPPVNPATTRKAGRPPKYDLDDRENSFVERDEAGRESSRKYERKRKVEKDLYRQNLENSLFANNSENRILSQRLASLKIQCDNLFKANSKFLHENDRKIYHQKRNI